LGEGKMRFQGGRFFYDRSLKQIFCSQQNLEGQKKVGGYCPRMLHRGLFTAWQLFMSVLARME